MFGDNNNKNNNPFNILSQNNTNTISSNETNPINPLFGFKGSNPTFGQKKETNISETNGQNKNPFSINLNNNNTLFGNNNNNNNKSLFGNNNNSLFGTNNNNSNSLFGDNNINNSLFGPNNNSLFGVNNNKTNNDGNNNKLIDNQDNNNNFNFNAKFELKNNNTNNSANINSLFGPTKKDDTNNIFQISKKDENNNPFKNMSKEKNNINDLLINKSDQDNTESIILNIFKAPNDESNKNKATTSSGLFDNKIENNIFNNNNKNNDNTEKEKNGLNLFNNKIINKQTNDNKSFLFGNNSNINNTNFNLFPKNNNNNANSLFSNQETHQEEEKEKEKEEQKDEKEENILGNSNYNPFINNNNNNTNNFGNIFSLNNKEIEKQKKEEGKKNIFEKSSENINIDKQLFSNIKESEEKIDNNINTNEISNESSLFNKNKNNILFENLNKKKENINNLNEINDMDVEEEIKEDLSSNKSDIINNLWISDNEDIIDDDIDINKKIDYKKVEEKSKKNIPNNINNLNSLIIPEISEYYFNLMKSTDNNISFSSNFYNSINLSNKILEVLKNQIELFNDNQEIRNEFINIMTIYAYFDAFILHRNDIIYLMKLRDELFYKYYMPIETVINMDKKSNELYNMNRNNVESIINNLKNIYHNLSMLDLSKARQKMIELNRIYKEIIRKNILGDKTLEFNDLFLNMEKIITIYNDIYNLKENLNSKQIISSFNMNPIFQDVKETIFNLQRDILHNNRDDNIKKVFLECQKICGMFAGDIKYIINEYNINDINLIILSNIFYRFHLNDFIRGLQRCLNEYKKNYDKDNNLVNKSIITIIKNCDSNQIEIVQELKGYYPFLLRYHMIEILSQNNFIYQIENQEKYLKNEAFLFFEMLKDSKMPFKYYLNYFLFYPNYGIFSVESINDINKLPEDPSENIKEEGYRKALDYALIYISYRFNNYNKLEELIDEIKEIKNEINEKIKNNYSKDIIYKINKLCLNKFIEKGIYKYSLIYYIDNYKLENDDFQKSQIKEYRKQLCAENDLNYDYSKQFDKVIINFYLKTFEIFNIIQFKKNYEENEKKFIEEYNEFQELLQIALSKKNNFPTDNNVEFMINYIEFVLDVFNHNLNKISKNAQNNINIVDSTKRFFENCFPLPKCPSFIWYHILIIIKNVIDENIYLFNNDTFFDFEDNSCEQLFIWDKKLIYDLIKIEKMRGNQITYDEAERMYENAVTFYNDVIQGVYFNQNIFSIS